MIQKVSVVICSHSRNRWKPLREAIASVREQDFEGDIEVVIVIDGDDELCQLVQNEYGDASDVSVHCNEENVGVSTSRNNGMAYVGEDVDVVAFMDDDAVANPDWIAELAEVYDTTDAVAVGGRMTAQWETEKPGYLPEEYYWLIGVTNPGFAEPYEEIRNTFASNISFRREVFETLDGFAESIGRKDDANLQAEEPELGARLQSEYGKGVVYNPDAIVAHKIFDYRTDLQWLADRAFWQGYSKRAIDVLTEETESGAEVAYLNRLLTKSLPSRCRGLIVTPSIEKLQQLIMLIVLTAIVGLGYVYGITKYG